MVKLIALLPARGLAQGLILTNLGVLTNASAHLIVHMRAVVALPKEAAQQ